MRFTKAALAALLAITLYACKKEDEEDRDPCLQPRTTVLQARTMRRADTGTALIDTLLPFPLARPLSNVQQQFVYGGVRRIGRFSLPLDQSADSCRWSLQPDSAAGSLRDTMTFHYERQVRFLSNACGYTTFYDIRRISTTTHAIDSIVLQSPSITTDVSVENLRIYY